MLLARKMLKVPRKRMAGPSRGEIVIQSIFLRQAIVPTLEIRIKRRTFAMSPSYVNRKSAPSVFPRRCSNCDDRSAPGVRTQ